MSEQQQIQIDGDKQVVLRMTTHAAMFLSQMLGAQPTSVVTQAGQHGLLADISAQVAQQHGIAPEASQGRSIPGSAPVRLKPVNRAQRRAAAKK